jgi:preprotein translocase subunit SecD
MGLRVKAAFLLVVLAAALWGLWPTVKAYRPGGDPSQVKYKVNLGLDLQGGMFLDLAVDSAAAADRVLDRLAAELENALLDARIDYVSVEHKGAALDVELGSREKAPWDDQPFKRMLAPYTMTAGERNGFVFHLPEGEADSIKKKAADQALEVIRNRIDSLGVSEPSLQKQGASNIIVQLPGLKNREAALAAIGTQAVLEFYIVEDNASPTGADPTRYSVKYLEARDASNKVIRREPYVLGRTPVLSGETIRDARVQLGNTDGRPYVSISFDSMGAAAFERITTKYRQRRLAIVLDDKVQSAPVIREPITGGEATITGQFTMAEATNLAVVLRSGALPAPLTIAEERSVGATLGEDSIRQGLMSLGIGFVSVVVFMLIYYRGSGAFASLALLLNVLLILAALAAFQATLTLPGIAGIVLTMGMAVDANVLIFERIREELLRGTVTRTAIDEGFRKAIWTIFDANLTTMFAAFALLAFGTGPIKGFAVTLIVGIIASLFTAIYVTRFFFDLFYSRRPRLAGVSI